MSYWYLWFILFMLLFIIPAYKARQQRQKRIAKRNRLKRNKEGIKMNEVIKSYIGKEVIIYTGGSSGVSGIVTKLEDNWIEIEYKDKNKQIVNLDYISRIQEYPRNKKGKKKAVIY